MSDKNSLISNIPPPAELPSYIIAQQPEEPKSSTQKFTPALPAENSHQSEAEAKAEGNATDEESHDLPSVQDIAQALSPITDGVKNSALFGWVKDTVKTGSHSFVQKAKESIDAVVTTLDPQMSHLIYSGGNIEVVVASANDDKIMSVREAFQSVFGRATVYGHPSQGKSIAAQPVGFENAELAAKERINNLRTNEAFLDKVIVAVENSVVEIYKNQWFDVGLLLLCDPKNNISLHSFTQMTPIPLPIITSLESDTPKDYDKRGTGFAIPVGAAMSRNLDTPHYEWHKTYTSIDRIDMIINAAKTLASIYQRELHSKIPVASKDESK